ncbi:hypothetical protein E2C01_006728 [Portunus trituberculatus]|uniref:Uncharacterized protein n=1 Tax=Portunus trituberculatus TaxID=210409 RepID=A0A5B7D2L0_PORTR|nr:hypothetical protein [Portunus trituberculatus]
MSHASLVAQKGSQMDRLGAVILRESLHLGAVAARPLLGVEGHRPMARGAKLAKGHKPIDEHKVIVMTSDSGKQVSYVLQWWKPGTGWGLDSTSSLYHCCFSFIPHRFHYDSIK